MYLAAECVCPSLYSSASYQESTPAEGDQGNEFMLLAGKCAMISGAASERGIGLALDAKQHGTTCLELSLGRIAESELMTSGTSA